MKKILAIAVPVALVIGLYLAKGPYLFPTSVALGPCLMDWTSPSTWSPRASPMKTLDFTAGSVHGRVCYGSPETRGRRLFGPSGIVPPGRLWRMGANEPTRLFLDGPVMFGDLRLERGRYSIYAEPGTETWEVFATGSTWHWGNEISSEVRAQQVGSIQAFALRKGAHQESLEYLFEAETLVMAWGFTRLQMPLSAVAP
ncbi:MAG: hypothetical protein ACI84D_002248 [Thalassolituus oleivorans]|jgi:hypothetical protein